MARMRVFMVFVLAVTAGGALAFGTYNYMQHLPTKTVSIPTQAVVVAASDLDIGTAPRLCWRIDEARRRWIRALVLDLTQTDFCDSTGLRALAGAERELTAQRARMAVVVPANGPVARLFDVAGAHELFRVHPTRDAALAAVR